MPDEPVHDGIFRLRRRPRTRLPPLARLRGWARLVLVAVSLAQGAALSAADGSEAALKAAFLYNFALYTEWPSLGPTFEICVIGKDSLGDALDALGAKAIAGRPIRIRRLAGTDVPGECNLLFVAAIAPGRLDRLLAPLAARPLLTVADKWAMREAFAQAAEWNARFGPLFVAVNVSGRQFRDREFASKAEAIARQSGLARDMSELELTESIVMEHTGEAVHLLEDLSARGFALALDDFGTGYSSLSYLKRFPLDKLKIDHSFVKDLPDDVGDAAIAEAIVGLARTLSMRVVAEGIETAAQARMLRELGCQYGQGYFFARPMPAQRMATYIAENLAARA